MPFLALIRSSTLLPGRYQALLVVGGCDFTLAVTTPEFVEQTLQTLLSSPLLAVFPLQRPDLGTTGILVLDVGQ